MPKLVRCFVAESNEYEAFLIGLRRSGLVGEEILSWIKDDHRATCRPNSTPEAMLRDLAIKLVGNAVLTIWQCSMIKHGKHDGFFIGHYEIQDYIGVKIERQDVQAFLARDVRDPMLEVVLEFEHFTEEVNSGREPKFSITFQRRAVSKTSSEVSDGFQSG